MVKKYCLNEQKFKTSIKTSYSSPLSLICGVPHESIFGQILFLLYINELIQVAVSDSLLFADDTCIVPQYKNLAEIEKQLLRSFSTIYDWLLDNKLSLYFSQDNTKSTIFRTKHKIRNAKALNIGYNGTVNKEYAKVKYLGCILKCC